MAPTMEDIEELRQQYSDLGIEMSSAMAEGLYNYNLIAVLADNGKWYNSDGISDGIDGSYILGQEMGKAGLWDSFYDGLLSEAKSSGYVVMYDYIKKGAAEETVRPVVEGMYAWSQETIRHLQEWSIFSINEMGLYAKPAGGAADTEVLYSITTTAGENGDFMPPYNGYNPAQITQDYFATVNNSAEVTINTAGAALLVEDANKLRDDSTKQKYKIGIDNGLIYLEEVDE